MNRPVLRYHGGKFRLAPWILEFFPPHQIYVEPFGGAAGVLIQKPCSHGEVYNDLDGDIVNLFRVLRSPEQRQLLLEQLVLTPYARAEFDLAYEDSTDPVERARRTCIRATMGFGSAGATKGKTGFRLDCQRKYATAQQLWASYPDGLSDIGSRLAGVLIENRDALDCMRDHDTPDTLHYVDPPYVFDTRVVSGNRYYRHEMTDANHQTLLAGILDLTGMVVVSGYAHPIYDEMLASWETHSTSSRISAGRGTATRTETVWLNPACSRALHAQGLFEECTT